LQGCSCSTSINLLGIEGGSRRLILGSGDRGGELVVELRVNPAGQSPADIATQERKMDTKKGLQHFSGTVEILSEPGKNTRVDIVLPIDAKPETMNCNKLWRFHLRGRCRVARRHQGMGQRHRVTPCTVRRGSAPQSS
jgi:hypothetical protein